MEQSSGNVFGFAPRIAHCVSCVSSGKTANGSTYGTCDTGTLSCRIVHVLAKGASICYDTNTDTKEGAERK